MRVYVTLVAVCVCAHGADPLGRDSPQSSVLAFLQAYHSKDYRRASRYLDLRQFPQASRAQRGAELAEQLGQILDSDTRFDEAALSSQPNTHDREKVASIQIGGKTQQLELERHDLRPGVAVWLFSADSVEAIPRLMRMTADSPIEKYVPAPLVTWKLFNTQAWRWLALVLAALLAWALARIACRLALLLSDPVLGRLGPSVRSADLAGFLRPARLMVATIVFRAVLEWIGPAPLVRKYLEYAVSLVFFWSIGWLAIKALDLGVVRLSRTLQQRHHTFAYSVVPMATRVSKLLIGVLAAIAILSSWGYNTTAILAGLGVGGVAIALAAQKTIENLFGGVAVITDRPVVVGDVCKFGDRSGTVEDIGLRSTRIRTPERTLITVPNGAFSSMTLENLSRKDKTWFHLMLNLRRDTTPEQVRDLLRSLTQILNRTPKVEPGNRPVRFMGVGTYSLDLEIGAYFNTLDDEELAPIQEDLYLRILDAVEEAGTSLALPTQAYSSFNREDGHNGAPAPHHAGPVRGR